MADTLQIPPNLNLWSWNYQKFPSQLVGDSEMKKLAAWDFEDLLQVFACPLPCKIMLLS